MAALSVDYRETVLARIQDSPAYAAGLLKSALEMMANGEEAEARETVKDLIHATGGFESMAEHLGINAKSLHRMLGPNGNPAFGRMSAIFSELSQRILHSRAELQLKAAA